MARTSRFSLVLSMLLLASAAYHQVDAQEGGILQPIPDASLGAGGIPGENSLGLSAAPAEKKPGSTESVFGGQVFGGAPSRFWIKAEYLYWWTKGSHVPALVTEGTATTGLTDANDPAGSLGYPGTSVVVGDSTFNGKGKSGFRIAGGMWLDACQNWGVEADYFNVGGNGEDFLVGSDPTGSPVIARPYYDVQNARNWRQLVSYPNVLSGTVSVASSDFFDSAGILVRRNLITSGNCCPTDPCDSASRNGCRIDLLGGYRYYGLSDKIIIQENLSGLGALRGTTTHVTDTFLAQNIFNGGEIGFSADTYRGRWGLNMLMKMAIGNNHQTTVIGGKTIQSNSQGTNTVLDGVYAVSTNSGTYYKDDFTVIPQIGLTASYQITQRFRVYAGYNLIYWAAVQRAADAIDTNIDPRNIPSPTPPSGATHFPQFTHNGSSFWAQGGNVGLEYRF